MSDAEEDAPHPFEEPRIATPDSQPDRYSSKAASASIEAWLEQTPYAHTGVLLETSRKRKLSVSRVDETAVSCWRHEEPELVSQKMAGLQEHGQIQPLTPAKSHSTQSFSTPTTDSQSSRLGDQKFPMTTDWVAKSMKRHHLYFKDLEAWNRYPDFKQDILDIVNPDRKSTVKPRSLQKFQERLADFEGANEDSFLENVLPKIIKETHTVRQVDGGEPKQVVVAHLGSQEDSRDDVENGPHLRQYAQQEYHIQEYYDDGLRMTRNAEFRKSTLPNIYLEYGLESKIAKALAKSDGMKNPRPDYTYGLKHPLFTPPHDVVLSPETDLLLEVAPYVHQPFLVIEGKSDKGELAEAENQARRAGAALVNAGRALRKRIGEEDVKGADTRTFVFSVTVGPKTIEVWVHWAEVSIAGVVFHMNLLASKSMSDEEALRELRQKLHNILDWGCIGRMREMERLYERIHEWERERMRGMVRDRVAREGEAGRKKRKVGEV